MNDIATFTALYPTMKPDAADIAFMEQVAHFSLKEADGKYSWEYSRNIGYRVLDALLGTVTVLGDPNLIFEAQARSQSMVDRAYGLSTYQL